MNLRFWERKPDEEQEETQTVERFDDVLDDDEQDPALDEGEADEEEEVSEETASYTERIVEKREAALLAKVRASLQEQGLDWTGEGAAIRDVNTFAAKFGFANQQQEQPRQAAPPAETADPYAALGERPDPLYDEDGARAWDRAYRAAIKAEAMAEVQPRLQQLEGMLAQTQVENATDRAQRLLRELGHLSLADHPDFGQVFGEALIQSKQPMETWADPAVLTGIAGWVIPRLKPVERQERPRDEAGRYASEDAARRSLSQVSAPRESGRAAASPAAGMDATTRALAQSQGYTPEEWLHYKNLGSERTEAEHDDWVRRRTRSGRR